MRPISIGLLILLAAAAGRAGAQTWEPYSFSESGFTAQYPARPSASAGSYTTSTGLVVPAMTYKAEQDGVTYSVTVADFSGKPPGQDAAIEDGVKVLARTGEIKVDARARIDRDWGRELSIAGRDGTLTAAAVFFVKGKLYVLTGTVSPSASPTAAMRATRFEETLEFDGGAALRPENRPGFPGGGAGRPAGGPGGRPMPPPQAFEACRGKALGDAVQLVTPRGALPATCENFPKGLAARPLRPPSEGESPPG